MWMFYFMKWAVLLWFLLFILLCYSVKLGKNLFVYMWIWFGIWCLLLIKAKLLLLLLLLLFCLWIHGVEWEAKSKEEEEIVNSSPSFYLLFGVFIFLLISIFVLYWNIKCFFFSLFYYGLPALPLILLLTIIPIFVSLWFHMFESVFPDYLLLNNLKTGTSCQVPNQVQRSALLILQHLFTVLIILE